MKKKPDRIKKPNRKDFRREHGPRYNIEFSKAMRKYRKQERESAKAGPKQTSTSKIGRITDPAALRREARSFTSKETETVKTPAPVEPKSTAKPTGSSQNTRKPKPVQSKNPKPVEPTSKPKPKKSGVTGQYRGSNPPSPTVTRSRPSGGGRSGANRRQEDPRARSVKRNLQEAAAAKARRERKEAFSAPYGGIASRPPANPKEGDMYKRPFGPVMIYKDGRFIRKK